MMIPKAAARRAKGVLRPCALIAAFPVLVVVLAVLLAVPDAPAVDAWAAGRVDVTTADVGEGVAVAVPSSTVMYVP